MFFYCPQLANIEPNTLTFKVHSFISHGWRGTCCGWYECCAQLCSQGNVIVIIVQNGKPLKIRTRNVPDASEWTVNLTIPEACYTGATWYHTFYFRVCFYRIPWWVRVCEAAGQFEPGSCAGVPTSGGSLHSWCREDWSHYTYWPYDRLFTE